MTKSLVIQNERNVTHLLFLPVLAGALHLGGGSVGLLLFIIAVCCCSANPNPSSQGIHHGK
jgi:hypothetical protein